MKKRPIIYKKDRALVELTQGKFSKIDVQDGPEIGNHNWYTRKVRFSHLFYALRSVHKDGGVTAVFLHNEIMPPETGKEIDHRNGNGLDNRRSNLRACSHMENLQNSRKSTNKKFSSLYKGVDWHKRAKRWRARITVDRKRIDLGTYTHESQAAIAYDRAAIEHFGNFAYLNFQDI